MNHIESFISLGDSISVYHQNMRKSEQIARVAGRQLWNLSGHFQGFGELVVNDLKELELDTTLIHKVVHLVHHSEYAQRRFENAWVDAKAYLLAMMDQMKQTPARDDDKLHEKALSEWNAGATWKNICKKLTGKPDDWKKFSQAVKRYATRKDQTIRTGSPGVKSKRTE